MARSAASYAVRRASFSPRRMKHCFAVAPQYEASPLRSDMKHSLRLYDEKMKNESLPKGQKNMKPGRASFHTASAVLHGTQCRFIRRQACFIFAPPDEALFRCCSTI